MWCFSGVYHCKIPVSTWTGVASLWCRKQYLNFFRCALTWLWNTSTLRDIEKLQRSKTFYCICVVEQKKSSLDYFITGQDDVKFESGQREMLLFWQTFSCETPATKLEQKCKMTMLNIFWDPFLLWAITNVCWLLTSLTYLPTGLRITTSAFCLFALQVLIDVDFRENGESAV